VAALDKSTRSPPRFSPSTLYNTAEREAAAASGTPRAPTRWRRARAPPPSATGP